MRRVLLWSFTFGAKALKWFLDAFEGCSGAFSYGWFDVHNILPGAFTNVFGVVLQWENTCFTVRCNAEDFNGFCFSLLLVCCSSQLSYYGFEKALWRIVAWTMWLLLSCFRWFKGLGARFRCASYLSCSGPLMIWRPLTYKTNTRTGQIASRNTNFQSPGNFSSDPQYPTRVSLLEFLPALAPVERGASNLLDSIWEPPQLVHVFCKTNFSLSATHLGRS